MFKLSEDELAFYDALEVNDSAVKVLGEPTLISRPRARGDGQKERNDRLDCAREHARPDREADPATYGYPSDRQEKATQTVLEQAARLFSAVGRVTLPRAR